MLLGSLRSTRNTWNKIERSYSTALWISSPSTIPTLNFCEKTGDRRIKKEHAAAQPLR
ncbi:hypothetical protein P692DRAFT_201791733 [Suillus brevipes Sb2]|nr:hypothetical protein P692DRAFT_201791733 [Suillus brevipes Sb2]